MNKQSNNSRRDFIKITSLAAAGSAGLLRGEWQNASPQPAVKNAFAKLGKAGDIHHLPLQILGLTDIPAVPFVVESVPKTLLLLGARSYEVLAAKNGLNATFNINGTEATGFAFMYGRPGPSDTLAQDGQDLLKLLGTGDINSLLKPTLIRELLERYGRTTLSLTADPLTALSLDDPKQFALSWTSYYNISPKATQALLPTWAATLNEANTATEQFWPTLSRYGLAYNLLFLKKANQQHLNLLRQQTGYDFLDRSDFNELATDGNLYTIDLTIFNTLDVGQVEGSPRFTPATTTLLRQDPITKDLTPFAIVVTGKNGVGSQTFVRGVCTDGAWLYALQAAKASITVYGIWIGHVYHWHIVTAAMAMTLYNNLPSTSPLFALLNKQSQYLIEFNEVLLLAWRSIAPPSSVTSGWQLLELMNTYASGRTFFDDDPLATLNNLGLSQADFTTSGGQPWDKYPVVGQLLEIWQSTSTYVRTFVDAAYVNDAAVAGDSSLQAWMQDAADVNEGNIKGLPTMNSKEALVSVLTSYLYRINAHGCSRLIDSANPSLTFVANFPPCLQKSEIPLPSSNISTRQLLEYLPKTGTIGEMINFYFIFAFSAPYDSFIPPTGITSNLLFPGDINDARNRALIQLRMEIAAFIEKFSSNVRVPGFPVDAPQYQQWPFNIET